VLDGLGARSGATDAVRRWGRVGGADRVLERGARPSEPQAPNRGDTDFQNEDEDQQYGDFVGLDDLFTEHPRVAQGMVDIYNSWVDYGVDGFRIDTTKHVNTEFWQKFGPEVLAHAKANGNKGFFM